MTTSLEILDRQQSQFSYAQHNHPLKFFYRNRPNYQIRTCSQVREISFRLYLHSQLMDYDKRICFSLFFLFLVAAVARNRIKGERRFLYLKIHATIHSCASCLQFCTFIFIYSYTCVTWMQSLRVWSRAVIDCSHLERVHSFYQMITNELDGKQQRYNL